MHNILCLFIYIFMHSSADGNQFISYLHYYKYCYYAYENVAILWIYISNIDFWLLLLCFLRNFHFVFHDGHAKTYSHQGYTRRPFLDTSSNTFGFYMIITAMTWYLTIVLMYISLIIGDAEPFFLYSSISYCKPLINLYLGPIARFRGYYFCFGIGGLISLYIFAY